MRLKILLTIILLTTSCARQSSGSSNPATPAGAGPNTMPESEMMRRVGENVSLHGKFSVRGKLGPYILVDGIQIYLIPRGNFSWGKEYERLEGRDVRVSGVLRFAHYEHANQDGSRDVQARAFDHFYFETGVAKIELNGG